MPDLKPMICALALAALLSAGCAQEPKGPLDQAVDHTKDALNDAAAGVKDAAQDARQELKKASQGPG